MKDLLWTTVREGGRTTYNLTAPGALGFVAALVGFGVWLGKRK